MTGVFCHNTSNHVRLRVRFCRRGGKVGYLNLGIFTKRVVCLGLIP